MCATIAESHLSARDAAGLSSLGRFKCGSLPPLILLKHNPEPPKSPQTVVCMSLQTSMNRDAKDAHRMGL